MHQSGIRSGGRLIRRCFMTIGSAATSGKRRMASARPSIAFRTSASARFAPLLACAACSSRGATGRPRIRARCTACSASCNASRASRWASAAAASTWTAGSRLHSGLSASSSSQSSADSAAWRSRRPRSSWTTALRASSSARPAERSNAQGSEATGSRCCQKRPSVRMARRALRMWSSRCSITHRSGARSSSPSPSPWCRAARRAFAAGWL
mmetsp:Transcript_13126/g.39104  ORF Transcript_13126/g.39104 Transcript_13126/m.39104 type:complete len:211 (+) Transcript_13126:137-769(+)